MNLPDCKEQKPVAWRYGALLYHDKLDAMEFIRTSGDSYLLEPLYTHPPQRTEQNYCPRCGKRTNDIHTCTPPREKNNG